jgi:5-methylcytosine-specific restriction endonuclease McrA
VKQSRAEVSRRWRQAHPERPLVYDARRRARRRGVPFDLTHDDVAEIIAVWSCAYCHTPVGTFTGGLRPQSATLDRLIPELGYTRSNVILACHRCNSEKGEHTVASFRAWADRIEALINRKNPTEGT